MKINNPITGAAMLASEDNGITLYCAVTGRLFYIFDDAEQVYLSAITGRVYAIKSENKLIDPITGVTLGIYNEDGSILSSAITGRELAIVEGGDPPGDPPGEKLVLYLPFDTDFNDVSDNAIAFTQYGGSSIDNTNFVSGGGSFKSGTAASGPIAATVFPAEKFNLAEKDFVFEAYGYIAESSNMILFSKADIANSDMYMIIDFAFGVTNARKPCMWVGSTSSAPVSAEYALPLEEWFQIRYKGYAAEHKVDVYVRRISNGNWGNYDLIGTLSITLANTAAANMLLAAGALFDQGYMRSHQWRGNIDEMKLIISEDNPPDPPVTGPVAYWQFDTDFADASGNGYDLTMVQGSVAINNSIYAKGGGSLECAYSPSGYLELVDSGTLEDFNLQGKDFTLEFFICAKNDNDLSGSIIVKHVARQVSSSTATAWGFEIGPARKLSVRVGGTVYPISFQLEDKTRWWKLAYVYSAAEQTVDIFAGRIVDEYEPLAYVGTLSNIVFGKVDTATVTIGGALGFAGGRFDMFNGFIDELKLTYAKLYTKPEGV